MNGVTFGDTHTDEWGIKLLKAEINFPELEENLLKVPGMTGYLDITDFPMSTPYGNRTMTLTFMTAKKVKQGAWDALLSRIGNYLHGRKMKIILDQDKCYYYYGRCYIDDSTDREQYKIVIRCNCDPYKYEVTSSVDDWEWDSFNFETGIIRDYKDISVEGNLDVAVYGSRMPTVPIIITDSAEMTVEYQENLHNLAEGENQILDIELHEGENHLIFTGTGTISIEFWGGSL